MISMFLIEVVPDRFGVYSAGVSVIAGCVVELDMLFLRHVCRTSIPYIENVSWCDRDYAMLLLIQRESLLYVAQI